MFSNMNNIFSYYFRVRFVVIVAIVERAALSMLYFFLLCVAERTFKEVSFKQPIICLDITYLFFNFKKYLAIFIRQIFFTTDA